MRVVIPDGKDDARGHSGRQGRCAWLFRAARTMRVVIPDGKDDARGYSGRQGRCAWLFRTARTMRKIIPDGKDDARGYSGRFKSGLSPPKNNRRAFTFGPQG